MRRQLEQRCECWGFLLEFEQFGLEREYEHRRVAFFGKVRKDIYCICPSLAIAKN